MITVSVDDKTASARLISDMMKKLDPDGTHEEEKDPERALEKIVRLHPDIVWLDIEMSGMNGLELAAEIKKRSPFTNIVFVTGHPEYAIDGFSRIACGASRRSPIETWSPSVAPKGASSCSLFRLFLELPLSATGGGRSRHLQIRLTARVK